MFIPTPTVTHLMRCTLMAETIHWIKEETRTPKRKEMTHGWGRLAAEGKKLAATSVLMRLAMKVEI